MKADRYDMMTEDELRAELREAQAEIDEAYKRGYRQGVRDCVNKEEDNDGILP